jgi:ABC-type phosphate transport system permease subunit
VADAVRFISDILVSAPSIVIGVFVYALIVRPFGGFSAAAGAVALAIIMLPVVTRTAEEMLKLVPRHEGAALALGAALEGDGLVVYRALGIDRGPSGVARVSEPRRFVHVV